MSTDTNGIVTNEELGSALLEAQNAVRVIWQDVLGEEAPKDLGVDDDFFDIGGTSLSLIAVVTKMSEHFGTEFPTGIVVNGATIGALAESALQEVAAAKSAGAQLGPQPSRVLS